MSAYRDELEAARQRIAALEERLAEAKRHRPAGAVVATSKQRVTLMAVGLGALALAPWTGADDGSRTPDDASGSPPASNVDRRFASWEPSSPAAGAFAPPEGCGPKHGYIRREDLPPDATFRPFERAPKPEPRVEPGAMVAGCTGDCEAEPSFLFGDGTAFVARRGGSIEYSSPAWELLRFRGGRLLTARSNETVVFALDERQAIFALEVRLLRSATPHTGRLTLSGFDARGRLVDVTIAELPGEAENGATGGRDRFLAVESCASGSLSRAELQLDGEAARIEGVLASPAPPGSRL